MLTIFLISSLQDEATEKAEFVFGLIDDEPDGEITEEEFIKSCLEDQDLVRTIQD